LEEHVAFWAWPKST